jgi:hypothetical protein
VDYGNAVLPASQSDQRSEVDGHIFPSRRRVLFREAIGTDAFSERFTRPEGAPRLDPRPDLLTAEAVAIALLCGGGIRLAAASPPLAQACKTYGIPLAVQVPIA